MCKHTYVLETPKSKFKITATAFSATLIMILIYEVYTVTESCAEYSRQLVLRSTQALMQLNESGPEAEERLPLVILYKPKRLLPKKKKKVRRIILDNLLYNRTNHMALPKFSMHTNVTIPPIPRMGNYECKEVLCRELLTHSDWNSYTYCTERLAYHYKKNPKSISHKPGKCHFMKGDNRAAVALVSFPGSGNTWVRRLLEQATGICTGEYIITYTQD